MIRSKVISVEPPRVRFYPVSEEDRVVIRAELAELLTNLHFASSKRYPALLMYIVEKTLEGQADELKERVLGIEVFHRPADYDTNNDTVVRVAAGEVRKRLALTYHESAGDHAIQILLPTGSYVPEFYRQTAMDEVVPGLGGVDEAQEAAGRELVVQDAAGRDYPVRLSGTDTLQVPLSTGERSKWRKISASAMLFLLGAVCAALFLQYRTYTGKTAVDRFWQPVRGSAAPVLFCAGALVPAASGFTEASKSDDYPYISMATAGALASVGDQLVRSRTAYFVQPASSTTLTDMRSHPTILVGAYDNKWTILMLNELRYRFAPKPGVEIYDSKDAAKTWRRPPSQPYKDGDDYAIVARFHDGLTDNTMVVIAGLGKNGTEAAAQFVTTGRYLDLLDSRQGKGWATKNIEIVLKTAVVDSKTAAPTIEAVEVW